MLKSILDVLVAAGLPLTWVSEQREEFKQYLLKNETVDFKFKGKDYHIRIIGADVYPQGFVAVVNHLSDFSGVNMLCDIGNGTMNIMFVNDKKPNPHRCFTEKFGTHQMYAPNPLESNESSSRRAVRRNDYPCPSFRPSRY